MQFNGIATQEAIRKLINYLEMGISDFPKNPDDSPIQGYGHYRLSVAGNALIPRYQPPVLLLNLHQDQPTHCL